MDLMNEPWFCLHNKILDCIVRVIQLALLVLEMWNVKTNSIYIFITDTVDIHSLWKLNYMYNNKWARVDKIQSTKLVLSIFKYWLINTMHLKTNRETSRAGGLAIFPGRLLTEDGWLTTCLEIGWQYIGHHYSSTDLG